MQTYKMIGTDGAEYGPVTFDDFQTWIRDGRVDGATHVMRSDQQSWSTAASFPELGVRDRISGAGGSGATAADLDPAEAGDLEKKIKSCGSWFYWIAALTLINSAVSFGGGEWGFYLGFTVIQALDAVVQEAPALARGIVLAFDILVAIGFGTLGIFAGRRHIWAFSIGVVLYGLDTVLTLILVFIGGSIIGVALHAWAAISLIIGIKAAIQWKKLQREAIG